MVFCGRDTFKVSETPCTHTTHLELGELEYSEYSTQGTLGVLGTLGRLGTLRVLGLFGVLGTQVLRYSAPHSKHPEMTQQMIGMEITGQEHTHDGGRRRAKLIRYSIR